ncbi:MAG: phosphotransferase [Gammaproteobacteria bacterium]|nr:phosphotransferase [Gammaproteobacteria bacterium]
MNKVLRANLSDGQSLIFKQSLPYVAKYPDIAAPIERLDTEAEFYAAVSSNSELSARVPKILGYNPQHHLLCMQDLHGASDMTSLYQIGQADQVDQDGDNCREALTELLVWLSKLHSQPIADLDSAKFQNMAMRRLNHQHIFDLPFNANNGFELPTLVAEFARQHFHDNNTVTAARRLGDIYLGRYPDDSMPCLLHGDYYPGSWLQHKSSGAMIIDPEFSFIGPAEFDLGVMFAHLMMAGVSEVSRKQLMQAYTPSNHFNSILAQQFTGVEITRRLLGIAQLPLQISDHKKCDLLMTAHNMLMSS